MYISRVEIDNNRRKIKDLSHSGAYHNWVERTFPHEIQSNVRSRKLWRVDKINGKRYLIIVSDSKPDHIFLERYGKEGSAISKKYEGYVNGLKNGDRVRFKVVLNPTISIKGEAKRGIVKNIVGNDYLREYFRKKADKHGFDLQDSEFYITYKENAILKKMSNRVESFSRVTFEGVLTITDEKLFKAALKNGIGRKKAYGCGLMTVIK